MALVVILLFAVLSLGEFFVCRIMQLDPLFHESKEL